MRVIAPLFASLLPLQVFADPPRIVTDIAPVHSLVAQVMGDIGEADVLITGAADPHDFQFTFSQAEAVQTADLVIWMGPELTPWLDEALDNLAPDAARLTLLATDGWEKLGARDWEVDDHVNHNDHDADTHADHNGALDPHAWLSIDAASIWTHNIALTLGEMDPENAAIYMANAEAEIENLAQLDSDITAQLAGLEDVRFMVPHDAYQYFGESYGVVAVGAITLSDGQSPSPAKIAELQDTVREQDVVCVLSDPQARREWGDLVREGTPARTALTDPMGGAFDAGPNHYRETMMALAEAYVACLSGP